MKYFIIAILFPVLSFAQFENFRSEFKKGNTPELNEITFRNMTCVSATAFHPETVFGELSMYFVEVAHNKNMIFNNNSKGSDWNPTWFSFYQGLRTSISFHTNFWDRNECANENPNVCGKLLPHPLNNPDVQTEMLVYGYIRKVENKFFVEWTTKAQVQSNYSAISIDKEVGDQLAIMYSECK
jgi:hypothetical protein